MRIRFNQSLCGSAYAYHVGDVVEWANEAEAARLVAAGIAGAVAAPEQTETPERSDAEHVETPAGELDSSSETAVETPAADPAGAASAEATAAPKKKRGRPAKAKPGVEAPAAE